MTREEMRKLTKALPSRLKDYPKAYIEVVTALRQLLNETEWQPIVRAPNFGTRDKEWRLGWTPEYGCVKFRWDWWCYVDQHGMEVNPTHYRSLPAGPSKEGDVR